jgi:hypothetical protein
MSGIEVATPTTITDGFLKLIISVVFTTSAANNTGIVTDALIKEFLDQGLPLADQSNILSSIYYLSHTLETPETTAPISLFLKNIPTEYAGNHSNVIDTFMSFQTKATDTTKAEPVFASLNHLYKALLDAGAPSTGCVDWRDLTNWTATATKQTITLDVNGVVLGDLVSICKNFASAKARILFAAKSAFGGTAAVVVAASAANDNVTWTDGASVAASAKLYLQAAFGTDGTGANAIVTANSEIEGVTTTTPDAAKLVDGRNVALKLVYTTATAVIDINAASDAGYTFNNYKDSSVDVAFQLVKKLLPVAKSIAEYVNLVSDKFTAQTYIYENAITSELLTSKFAYSVDKVVTFVGKSVFTIGTTDGTIAWGSGLTNYVTPSTKGEVSSAFAGLFTVLKALGYSAAVAYKACRIATVLLSGGETNESERSVIEGANAVGSAVATNANEFILFRCKDFDRYFANHIKLQVPLLDRIRLLSLATTNVASSALLLTGADDAEEIYDVLWKNATSPNAGLITTPTLLTSTDITITAKTLYAATIAKATVTLTTGGTNTSPTIFGAFAATYERLYNKAKNASTAIFSQVVASVYKVAVNFTILKPVQVAPFDVNPDAAAGMALSEESLLEIYKALAPTYDYPNNGSDVPVLTSIKFANEPASVLDTVAFASINDFVNKQNVSIETLLSLPFQDWMTGAPAAAGAVDTSVANAAITANTTGGPGTTAASTNSVLLLIMKMILFPTLFNNSFYVRSVLDFAVINSAAVLTEFKKFNNVAQSILLINFITLSKGSVDNSIILTLMGTTKAEQLGQLKRVLILLKSNQLNDIAFLFKDLYTIDELIAQLTPLTVNPTEAITVTDRCTNLWPILYVNNVNFLVGPDTKAPKVSLDILLSYKRSTFSFNKLTGFAVSTTATPQLVFSPRVLQNAYSLSDAELAHAMSENGMVPV